MIGGLYAERGAEIMSTVATMVVGTIAVGAEVEAEARAEVKACKLLLHGLILVLVLRGTEAGTRHLHLVIWLNLRIYMVIWVIIR